MKEKIDWIAVSWISPDRRFTVRRQGNVELYDLYDEGEFVKTYLAVWSAMAEADRRNVKVRAA